MTKLVGSPDRHFESALPLFERLSKLEHGCVERLGRSIASAVTYRPLTCPQ
jgi:hypothetical protein